jgi:hypothetical protein
LYDKKNIPKVIYCIHALSHLLAKKGLAPHIKNLLGQLSFTGNYDLFFLDGGHPADFDRWKKIDEQLDKTNESLEAAAVPMPAFGNIQKALEKELDEPSEEESNSFVSCLMILQLSDLVIKIRAMATLPGKRRANHCHSSRLERQSSTSSIQKTIRDPPIA